MIAQGSRAQGSHGAQQHHNLEPTLAAIDPENSIRSKEPFLGDLKTVCKAIGSDPAVKKLAIAEFGRCFQKRSSKEWLPILAKHGVWHHTVTDVNDVGDDAQANAIGTFADIGAPFPIMNHPIKFSEAMPRARGRAPILGSHTDQVLVEMRRSTL